MERYLTLILFLATGLPLAVSIPSMAVVTVAYTALVSIIFISKTYFKLKRLTL